VDSVSLKTQQSNNGRRSQRVMLSMAIVVNGNRSDGKPFTEETVTSIVNVHGALILLGESVDVGTILKIRNVKSDEERSCRVADIGGLLDGKTRVGIKFVEPCPRLWRIAFPPENWSPRGPESKQMSSPKLNPSRKS
jgi:hypothetical protein